MTAAEQNPTAGNTSGQAGEKMIAPYCFAAVVAAPTLTALLEPSNQANGTMRYQDTHPWTVARRLLIQAQALDLQVALMLAAEDTSTTMSHWTLIDEIEILELTGKRYLSNINLGDLAPIPAIFNSLDSLFLKPPNEQLEREHTEHIRTHRQVLTTSHIRPYAICETPGFISGLADWRSVLPEA